jgi:hypothetical protein
MLGWVHQDQLRPVVELSDEDGLVVPGKVVALPQRDVVASMTHWSVASPRWSHRPDLGTG